MLVDTGMISMHSHKQYGKQRCACRWLYKKQKRQDWDHKAYHDAPSAI